MNVPAKLQKDNNAYLRVLSTFIVQILASCWYGIQNGAKKKHWTESEGEMAYKHYALDLRNPIARP